MKKFVGKKTKRLESEILEDLRVVESGLSPENLCCDGEATATYVRNMSAKLNAEKQALIAELGRIPSINEIYPTLPNF